MKRRRGSRKNEFDGPPSDGWITLEVSEVSGHGGYLTIPGTRIREHGSPDKGLRVPRAMRSRMNRIYDDVIKQYAEENRYVLGKKNDRNEKLREDAMKSIYLAYKRGDFVTDKDGNVYMSEMKYQALRSAAEKMLRTLYRRSNNPDYDYYLEVKNAILENGVSFDGTKRADINSGEGVANLLWAASRNNDDITSNIGHMQIDGYENMRGAILPVLPGVGADMHPADALEKLSAAFADARASRGSEYIYRPAYSEPLQSDTPEDRAETIQRNNQRINEITSMLFGRIDRSLSRNKRRK